jgi:hypothetical protein
VPEKPTVAPAGEVVAVNGALRSHDAPARAWTVTDPAFDVDADNDMFEVWPWAGHRAFAYDLIAFARPRRVVELGVHVGTSFFALLQGVKDAGLDTRIVGVDTWKGDNHTGPYDDAVYRSIRTLVDRHFQGLDVTLRRSTFREALPHVADGSIDLLHIDGFHTFDAVQDDFDTWLPKVAENGVVLFHDTAPDTGYGSADFWAQTRARFPHFEFTHSWGLGVLFPKGDALHRAMLENGFPERLERYRLSAELRLARRQLRDTEALVRGRDQALRAAEARAKETQALLARQDEIVVSRDRDLARQAVLLADREAAIAAQTRLIEERDALIRRQDALVADRDATIRSQAALVTERDALLKKYEARINELAPRADEAARLEKRLRSAEEAARAGAALREELARAHARLSLAEATAAEARAEADAAAARLVATRDLLRQQDRVLAARDADLATGAAFIADRDAAIASQTRMIDERNALLRVQDGMIAERNARIAELESFAREVRDARERAERERVLALEVEDLRRRLGELRTAHDALRARVSSRSALVRAAARSLVSAPRA